MRLETARWPDLKALSDRIFVVPLGSLEQHGKPLPVFNEPLIIGHVANRVKNSVATASCWSRGSRSRTSSRAGRAPVGRSAPRCSVSASSPSAVS
ncbi:hypothetical protein B4Q13_21700 [Lacticaseibacillus rhamnosus]